MTPRIPAVQSTVSRMLPIMLPASGLVAAISFSYATRHVEAVPLLPSDPIIQSKFHKQFNTNNNPTVHDLFIRKVPVSDINPSLLNRPGALIERFSRGVWASPAFTVHRAILSARLTDDEHTPGQLWSRHELLRSKYYTGTVITNEFIVLSKSKNSILIRGGDNVSKTKERPIDGLIELSVQLKPEENSVEFGFKLCFFRADLKIDQPPWSPPMTWLHEQYARALLESGVRHVLREDVDDGGRVEDAGAIVGKTPITPML
ncbi:uncharacterized protein N7515_000336 [Penicillium bovifimosum]|uniref:Uncharacterized protein n=1 Tax=Penicillium bovifimosum TaxID=126998 RepID=A0A9W9HHU1_9EURO|nr:uncharacterized protein N7515_000336 [Penicillium bovifimosum]KAJ5145772.1 hypothetical protein N7515_000336 [Penicillium bovifimosum]